MSKKVFYDAGDYAVFEDRAYRKVGIVYEGPDYSVTPEDIRFIDAYTWNYDDENVQGGSNHRTYTKEEMAACFISINDGSPINNRRNYGMSGYKVNNQVGIHALPIYKARTSGVLRVWGVNGFKILVNNVTIDFGRDNVGGQADAYPVKIQAGDTVSVYLDFGNDWYWIDAREVYYLFYPYNYHNSTIEPSVPYENEILRYSFGSTTNDVVIDDSGNGINATMYGGAEVSNGRIIINDDSKYARVQNQCVGDRWGIGGGASAYSIACNVNIYSIHSDQDSEGNFIASVFNDAGGWASPMSLFVNKDNKLVFRIMVDDNQYLAVMSKYSFPLNTYKHVAVTYDGKAAVSGSILGAKLYIDGQPIEILYDGTYIGDSIAHTDGLYIGACGRFLNAGEQKANLNGSLNQFRLHKRQLKDSEILKIYNNS